MTRSFGFRFVAFVVVTGALAALGAGCEPTVATVRFPAPDDAAPDYGQVPFPSDAYLEDGRIGPIPNLDDLVPSNTAALQEHLSALDGFGTRPVVEVWTEGEIDGTDGVTGVHVIGVSDGPDRGQLIEYEWRLDTDDHKRRVIRGAPARGAVLEERTTYAVVVTKDLRGKGGVVARAAGFDALIAQDADALPRRWRTTRAAFDLAAQRFPPSTILAVSAFTVQSARTPMLRARALLENLPAPTVTFDDPALVFTGADRLHDVLGDVALDEQGNEKLGWSHQTGIAHAHVRTLGTGTLHKVTFRRADLGGIAADGPDSGTFVLDDTGTPVVQGPEDIPLTFSIPQGTPPAEGWPVVIFGHGLGGSRAQMLAFIETAAQIGWAVVAIDASGHGTRFKECGADCDVENNVGARLGETFTGVHTMKDGFGDPEGLAVQFAIFHDMKNLAAMRDELRQSVLDLGQVALALRNSALDLSALAPDARVDGDRIVYLGESFGGVLGALFSAVEPHVKAFFLDVPGGGVVDLAACYCPELRTMIRLFVPSLYSVDGDALDRFHPLIGFGAAILDAGDPLSYARHVLKERSVLNGVRNPPRHVAIVMAMGDETLANGATFALAKAMGMPVVGPALDPYTLDVVAGPVRGNIRGQTAGLVQQSPATHGDNWTSEAGRHKYYPFDIDDTEYESLDEKVPVHNPVKETHAQVQRFLNDIAAHKVPALDVTKKPYADFDDDGAHDESDSAPYDPEVQ